MQIQISNVSQDIREINSSIVIVQPEFHLWSGRRALKPQKLKDLNPTGINLPPAGLASLGAVKLVDPEELKPFDKIKDEVNRKLASNGLHLFGGYAVHESDFQNTYAWLKDQVVGFEDLKASMLNTLDKKIESWVKDWVKKNPAYQHLLQDLPTAQVVFGKMSFDFHCYRVSAPTDSSGDEMKSEYERKIGGLSGELYREAAKEATILMSKYLVNEQGNARDYVTQKTLGPIKRISQRMRKFAFVDPSAGPLAELIDWTMQQVPEEGRVNGNALVAVWSMARLLANPEEALRIGAFTKDHGTEAAWDYLCSDSSTAESVVEVIPASATELADVSASNAAVIEVNEQSKDCEITEAIGCSVTSESETQVKGSMSSLDAVQVAADTQVFAAIQPKIHLVDSMDLFS